MVKGWRRQPNVAKAVWTMIMLFPSCTDAFNTLDNYITLQGFGHPCGSSQRSLSGKRLEALPPRVLLVSNRGREGLGPTQSMRRHRLRGGGDIPGHPILFEPTVFGRPGLKSSKGGSESCLTEPSLRDLFEQGVPIQGTDLLDRCWEGCVPFPSAAEKGEPYRTAQFIMAILARLSGWAGKSFRRSARNPREIEVQALDMQLAGVRYSLGPVGRADLRQQDFALSLQGGDVGSVGGDVLPTGGHNGVVSAIVAYRITRSVRDVLRKNPVDGSVIGLLTIRGREIGYFTLRARDVA